MHQGESDISEPAQLPDGVPEAVLQGRWFVERGEAPGFLGLVGGPGMGPVVPVFSSEEQLARYAGACDYFSTPGDDLLALLPEGHGLVVDLAGPDPQHLPPTAVDALRSRFTAEDGETGE